MGVRTQILDYIKMLYSTAIGSAPTADSAFERIKAIDDKIPSKTYLMGSADADGGFDTEAKADIEAQAEVALEDAGQVMVITTIATLASQTSFTLTAGSADDDAYTGMVAVIEDASTAAQKAVGVISNYVGGTKTITLREDPGVFTMAIGDKISIKAVSPDILNILADTNELQTDWVNGGRLDLLIDAIKAETDKTLGGETEGTATNIDLTAAAGGTSGENGADVFTITTTTRKKIHFLGISMANCTAAATITIRMYTKVLNADAALTKFYEQTFTQGTDGDLIPVIDGTIGIRNNVRVEMHSTAAGDNSVNVPYFYISEDMES